MERTRGNTWIKSPPSARKRESNGHVPGRFHVHPHVVTVVGDGLFIEHVFDIRFCELAPSGVVAEDGEHIVQPPSLYPYWYPEWEAQVEEYAAAHNLRYINFLELQEDTGIDYSTDTYDGGLHMNLSGAEKLSRFGRDHSIPSRVIRL